VKTLDVIFCFLSVTLLNDRVVNTRSPLSGLNSETILIPLDRDGL